MPVRRNLQTQTISLYRRVLQHALGERFMRSQKLSDIIFEGKLGMKFGPVMGCSHESQQGIQLLQVARSERPPQGLVSRRRVLSLEKNVGRA